ncbi:MAG: 16S rRNA processing protein RimM [Desulfobacterales bacterium CG23_combo_of_CG06-09_8_20_14_all_51_8]|nr:MAG: 16S rRNA processing protein RimM [Desulfobacterales bacterium CG23_combo_of_CG06-09_8_20_14_all_51_8]
MNRDDPLVLIGKIVGVHGMKGYLKVDAFDAPLGLFNPGRFFLLKRGSGEIQTVTVSDVEPHRNILRLGLEEVSDRTAVEGLVGSELLVKRSEMPEPEPGKWYWCDLIGLSVVQADGAYLGCVENLFETGGNDVLVVKHGDAEILIPVTASIVCDVDLEGKTIRVDLPEGLME